MIQTVRIKKGLNIKLHGLAEKVLSKCPAPEAYAVKPTDFYGVRPKMLVNEGDSLKAGAPLFCDKDRPEIVFVSPVAGTLTAVKRDGRGEILEVVVTPPAERVEDDAVRHTVPDLAAASRDELVKFMLKSGAWPFLKQRPFNVVADPRAVPKSIFISGFDSAPIAADADFLVNGEAVSFQKGVDVLRKLTSGTVHLGLCADYPANNVFERAKGVKITRYKGPHPAGNVGVHIHKLDPIGKGETVWTIDPQHVVVLGRLFATGVYDPSKVVALVGAEVKKPRYYRMAAGAKLSGLSELIYTDKNPRVISGNVLTGTKVGLDGYLGFYDNEVTVIPEGKHYEMLGWAMPRFGKFSMSRTYFSWLLPDKRYNLDTNPNGGQRPFVLSGEYEKVLPMDILPVYLLKAILANDIDKMEQLGIYEVVEEDLALCEFVCTSKIDVQEILRNGINAMMAAAAARGGA